MIYIYIYIYHMSSFFKTKNSLHLFLENMLDYCKTKLLLGEMISIPNLITNSAKFPLYGLHSTGYDVLYSIYENGFVPTNRMGISQENPIIAMFSIPFRDNLDKVVSKSYLSPQIDGITLSTGIRRALALEKLKPDDVNNQYLEFPIILSCFTGSPNISADGWVFAQDNSDIHIIGNFDIKVEKDANYKNYVENKDEYK